MNRHTFSSGEYKYDRPVKPGETWIWKNYDGGFSVGLYIISDEIKDGKFDVGEILDLEKYNTLTADKKIGMSSNSIEQILESMEMRYKYLIRAISPCNYLQIQKRCQKSNILMKNFSYKISRFDFKNNLELVGMFTTEV